MSKNLAKVQDMLDGNYKSKIQVGVGDQEVEKQDKLVINGLIPMELPGNKRWVSSKR